MAGKLPRGRRPAAWARTRPAWAGGWNTCWSTRPASTPWPSCARCRTGRCNTSCAPCRAWPKSRPVGGFVKQYQVTIDPDKLLAYNIPINKVVEQVRRGNQEVGGRVLEFTGREYMVRGRGYFQKPADIEEVAVGAQPDGTPIRVRDIGFVQIGPDIRRGVVDYNGQGDAAGGIVVVRFGESVYDVLQNVSSRRSRRRSSRRCRRASSWSSPMTAPS